MVAVHLATNERSNVKVTVPDSSISLQPLPLALINICTTNQTNQNNNTCLFAWCRSLVSFTTCWSVISFSSFPLPQGVPKWGADLPVHAQCHCWAELPSSQPLYSTLYSLGHDGCLFRWGVWPNENWTCCSLLSWDLFSIWMASPPDDLLVKKDMKHRRVMMPIEPC